MKRSRIAGIACPAPETRLDGGILLRVSVLAPAYNVLKRMHFMEYATIRNAWTLVLRGARPAVFEPIPRLGVTVHRYSADVLLDPDNLVASCKIPLDALQRSGWIVGDDPTAIHPLTVLQSRVPRRADVRTEILLSPHPEAAAFYTQTPS